MDAERLKKILSVFEGKRGALIPILQRVQEEFGYLPEEALAEVARFLKMPESDVFSVATFYAHFYLNRRGDHMVKVCLGTACHVRGARNILDVAQHRLGIKAGETTEDYKYSLERVACLGSCALAPIMVVDDRVHIQVSPKTITEMFPRNGGRNKEEDEKQD
jgi:NADH-quinone oxidoreductase subunit E